MDLSVYLLTVGILSIVPSGSDNNDPPVYQATNCTAEGIELTRIDGRHSEAQVDDADVVTAGVCHEPIECRQNA
jgi:hypothetical protein